MCACVCACVNSVERRCDTNLWNLVRDDVKYVTRVCMVGVIVRGEEEECGRLDV